MSENRITIEIDGEEFSEFESGSVTRRFDEFCGSFDFTCSKDYADGFNIDSQSYCNIYINGIKAITGVIDKISPSEDPSSSSVSISGRDITCDIVDSTLPSTLSISGGFTLVTVIEQVLKMFGLEEDIKVINEIEDLKEFTKADIVSSEVDKNAFDFLNDYAQKVSAILVTNANGDIVITRAGQNEVLDKFINIISDNPDDTKDNNLIDSSADYDYSNRFYKYIVVSQENTTTSETSISAESVSQKGIAYDTEVRESRVLVIKPENACNSATCSEIATLEANVRRANSLNYSCTVSGYQFNNGELYDINRLITVIDNDNFISSQLLSKGVTFNFGDASTTNFEFALCDAYTLQANLDDINRRTNETDKKKEKDGGKSSKKTTKKKSAKPKKNAELTPEEKAELDRFLGK